VLRTVIVGRVELPVAARLLDQLHQVLRVRHSAWAAGGYFRSRASGSSTRATPRARHSACSPCSPRSICRTVRLRAWPAAVADDHSRRRLPP
jgi:hypothetical protein